MKKGDNIMDNKEFDLFDALWCSPSTMPNDSEVISDETIVSKLKSIPDLELIDDEERTLLMNAVIYERPIVVEYLLSNHVDINKKDCFGFTALHFAVQTNNSVIVELLLKYGANTNIKNEHGNNAILLASDDIPAETFKLLLKYGSDPYQKNDYEVSAADVFKSNSYLSKLIDEATK